MCGDAGCYTPNVDSIGVNSLKSGRGGLRFRVPARGQRSGSLDIGREIDLAPFLALDVERPDFAVLCHLVDDAQVPDGRPLWRAHRSLDRLAEVFGAALTKCEEADRLGIHGAEVQPLADRLESPAVFDDLHVVIVVPVLAVDRDANARTIVGHDPLH